MESVVVDVRYGLTLVDALTGGALVGPWSVSVRSSDVARAYSPSESAWAVEGLAPGAATFDITADYYVPSVFVAGTDGPAVPAAGTAAPLVSLPLLPRTGYPFPLALTRVLGAVRYHPSGGISVPAVGARIQVFGVYSPPLPAVDGPVFETVATEDGQYTAWFLPVPSPPLASGYPRMPAACRVDLEFTPPSGPPLTASIPATSLIAQRTTPLPTVTFS